MNIIKILSNVYNYVARGDIFVAIKSNNIEKVKSMIQSGYDLNIQNSKGYTPIWYACNANRIDIIYLLLEQNNIDLFIETDSRTRLDLMYLNIQIAQKCTFIDDLIATIYCYSRGNDKMIILLTDILNYRDIDLEKFNTITTNQQVHKNTILTSCIYMKRYNPDSLLIDQLINVAIDKTNNLDIQVHSRDTALTIACSQNFEKIALQILQRKCNINIQNCYGTTAITFACQNKMTKIQKKLINKNCNVVTGDFFSETIENKQYNILKYYYLKQLKN